jgi:hypothetical protein
MTLAYDRGEGWLVACGHTRGEKDPLDVEGAVELAEQQLERACGEEICRTEPTDVFQRVELVCYMRDCGCNNGDILKGSAIELS